MGRRSRPRIGKVVFWCLGALMIAAGVALVASFFLSGRLEDSTATNGGNPGAFNVPKLETKHENTSRAGPEDKTLRLTVPAMARVKHDDVPYAAGTDEEALKENAAIHLRGTGFPWESEANVYIAGHRLGYPNTESWLTFWDLNEVGVGDEVYVTDANGTKYTYEVFKTFTVGPSDVSVTRPVEGKNVLTLQTCTLPDYKQRLIVQAELEDTQQKGEGS